MAFGDGSLSGLSGGLKIRRMKVRHLLIPLAYRKQALPLCHMPRIVIGAAGQIAKAAFCIYGVNG